MSVDGEVVAEEDLAVGRPAVMSRRLRDVQQGQIVAVQFGWTPTGATTSPPHTGVPVSVTAAWLSSDNAVHAAQDITETSPTCT